MRIYFSFIFGSSASGCCIDITYVLYRRTNNEGTIVMERGRDVVEENSVRFYEIL